MKQSLIEYLNTKHDLIKFSMIKDTRKVPYQDVEASKIGSSLQTKFFSKSTDTNNLLR